MGFATPSSTASQDCWCRRRMPRLSPPRLQACSKTSQSENKWETQPGNALETCSIPGSLTLACWRNTSGGCIAARPPVSRKSARRLFLGFRLATVAVVEAHDIVLAKIPPRLNLDQKERGLAWIFQSMLGANRDVGGFVFRNELYFIVSRHPRGARYHHPVLRPMVMHLQRERFARFDHDALDLKALAGVDAFVVTPGPIDPAV